MSLITVKRLKIHCYSLIWSHTKSEIQKTFFILNIFFKFLRKIQYFSNFQTKPLHFQIKTTNFKKRQNQNSNT